MAGRLALKLGIDDPEQWLELQPDRVIAFWEAFDARRPIGFEWEQYASVMSMLELLITVTVNKDLEAKDRLKARGVNQFLPDGLKEPVKKKKASLKTQLQLIARAYGGRYGDNNQ